MLRFPVVLNLLLLFAFGLLAGCSGSARLSSVIPGSTWTVERIVYPTGRVVRGDGETLSFEADGSLGLSSCNSCGGTYQIAGRAIEFSVGACTLRACGPEVIELEKVIEPQMGASRSGEYLVLTSQEDDQGLEVMLLPAPASP